MIKLIGTNQSHIVTSNVEKLQSYIKEKYNVSNSDKLELANAVFRRAPYSYLKNLTLEEQVNIIIEIEDFINELLEKKTSNNILGLKVSKSDKDNSTYKIKIALTDCSFIIDTIKQTLNYYQIEPKCHLHPLLEIGTELQLSLSYIEFRLGDLDDIKIIEKELTKKLESLVKITDSFSSMTKEISSFNLSGEEKELINWLIDDGSFIFMGTIYQNLKEATKEGLFTENYLNTLKIETNENTENFNFKIIPYKSPIHRNEYLNLLNFSSDQLSKKLNIIGIFSTKGESTPVLDIPIIRQKIKRILSEEGLVKNSHDHKEAIYLFDSLPKATLFGCDEVELKNLLRLAVYTQIQVQCKIS